MTGGHIHSKEERLSGHDEGAKGKAPAGIEMESVCNIPPLDDDDDHCCIEEITMKIVEDEQSLFPTVSNLLVDVRFIDPATCWGLEEGSVIHSTHVVACATESERDPKNEDRCVNPSGVVPFIETEETPLEDVW